MANRRSFMGGLLAAGLAPRSTWADAGNPAFLSAGREPHGGYVLCGLSTTGQITFKLPLPARGHAAAAHPQRAEAVAFARRPGTVALVIDCRDGTQLTALHAPEGRHFYGHGVFSANGTLLFTTENDFDAARGVIGVWDVGNGYRRRGEFASGGVGPHDIRLMPDGETLVVANGGIETHPETGRAKLNLPIMRANLCYVDLQGGVKARLELDDTHQRNSIRHLALAQDGTVAFAMQWQGDLSADRPLLGMHNLSAQQLQLMDAASTRRLNGYLGSIAMSADGNRIAVTSPRSGLMQHYQRGVLSTETALPDVCGVATDGTGFMLTTGTGLVRPANGQARQYDIAWDNHLIAIT